MRGGEGWGEGGREGEKEEAGSGNFSMITTGGTM